MEVLTQEHLLQRDTTPDLTAPLRPPAGKLPGVLNLLLLYLAAITIFGKGPTYIGIEPVFWGEIVLAVSLFWTVRRWNRVIFRTPSVRVLTFLILCFILVGAVEATMDFSTWGIYALRDSAVWYYSLFYFVGLAIASSYKESAIFASRWKLFWVISVPWGVAELLSDYRLSALSPEIPGHGPILFGSSSDIAQSVGLGCLLLVSDSRILGRWLGTIPRILVAVAGLATVASFNGRGARLAVLAAFCVFVATSISQNSGRSLRRNLSAIVLFAMVGLAVALSVGVDVMSALKIDRFEEASLGNLEGTAQWRSDWWSGIYDAVMDENPLFGLGFGDQLTEYNPYIHDEAGVGARAPHNFNMTIFARMGIIGSFIWGGILICGVFIPLFRILTASSPTARADAKYRSFWIGAIIAAWVNSSFGVLMEGPVMAIPFWLILGMLSMKASRSVQIGFRRSVEPSGSVPNPMLVAGS